jgi:hypothetical protein
MAHHSELMAKQMASLAPMSVLAMKSCYLNKLIENLLLLDSCSDVIPLCNRLDQFASGCQAQLSPDSVPVHVESERVTFS